MGPIALAGQAASMAASEAAAGMAAAEHVRRTLTDAKNGVDKSQRDGMATLINGFFATDKVRF